MDHRSYATVRGADIAARRATYTCPGCSTSSVRKTRPFKDNAGATFRSARCACGQLSLFADRHGSYVR